MADVDFSSKEEVVNDLLRDSKNEAILTPVAGLAMCILYPYFFGNSHYVLIVAFSVACSVRMMYTFFKTRQRVLSGEYGSNEEEKKKIEGRIYDLKLKRNKKIRDKQRQEQKS